MLEFVCFLLLFSWTFVFSIYLWFDYFDDKFNDFWFWVEFACRNLHVLPLIFTDGFLFIYFFSKLCFHFIFTATKEWIFVFLGYETLPIPIDSFQGLDLWSPSLAEMDMDGEIGAGELLSSMPSPPQGDNPAAAWYDTDL